MHNQRLPRNQDCHLVVEFFSLFAFGIENNIPGGAKLLGGLDFHRAAAIVCLWHFEAAIEFADLILMDFHLHSVWQRVKLDINLVEPVF